MKIYDRLYGEMKFPALILDLLNCPGLLRLRDVRMANNQFVSFPAFASTTRYEHSLGVCYLASLCANNLGLSERDTLELMMACLYHDVGTPPFAHAMEEVLQAKFGFDHEQNLKNLIMGTTGEFDGDMAQVFLGEVIKLKSVCQTGKARSLGLSRHRVAKIAVGDKDEILSPLLNGDGMDLDNIDNIIRASSAMGLISSDDNQLAVRLAHAFVLSNHNILYDSLCVNDIRKWQSIRDVQYTAIFNSIDDFSYQTMIKKAINLLLNENNNVNPIDKNSWNLTDSSIIHNYLLVHPKTREITRRVLLCKPFYCLGILYVQGDGITRYVNQHLEEIEAIAAELYKSFLGITEKKLKSIDTSAVVANYYPDKRKRQLKRKAFSWHKETIIDNHLPSSEGILLGLFTPFDNSNHKDFDIEGKKTRRSVSFKMEDFEKLTDVFSSTCLHEYKISLYGGDSSGKNTSETTENQLGLF